MFEDLQNFSMCIKWSYSWDLSEKKKKSFRFLCFSHRSGVYKHSVKKKTLKSQDTKERRKKNNFSKRRRKKKSLKVRVTKSSTTKTLKKFCAFIIFKSNIAKMFSTSVFKEVVRIEIFRLIFMTRLHRTLTNLKFEETFHLFYNGTFYAIARKSEKSKLD